MARDNPYGVGAARKRLVKSLYMKARVRKLLRGSMRESTGEVKEEDTSRAAPADNAVEIGYRKGFIECATLLSLANEEVKTSKRLMKGLYRVLRAGVKTMRKNPRNHIIHPAYDKALCHAQGQYMTLKIMGFHLEDYLQKRMPKVLAEDHQYSRHTLEEEVLQAQLDSDTSMGEILDSRRKSMEDETPEGQLESTKAEEGDEDGRDSLGTQVQCFEYLEWPWE